MNAWKIILPIIVILAAVGIFLYLRSNPVKPQMAETQEQIVLVEVLPLSITTQQVVVHAQGTVTPAEQIQIRPEITGRIIEISEDLVPGGVFETGDLIARIDSRDYETRLAAQKQMVANASFMLKQEVARKVVAEQEWSLLEKSIPANQENRDLALRIPQIEQARAALAAAEAGLAKAELDVARCSLHAPFNAIVIRESVDRGQLANPQTEVATLVGTDAYWVQASVPVASLSWIIFPSKKSNKGSEVRIVHEAGNAMMKRQGKVVRLLGDLDPAGRLARVLVTIDDPLNLSSVSSALPLLVGTYVDVDILGENMDDVVVVPRTALRDVAGMDTANGSGIEGIWIMDDDNRLEMRPVQVAWRGKDAVFLRNGFRNGERLVTSRIPSPIAGMKLKSADDLSREPPEGEATDSETAGRNP